eukprot:5449069-Prymnesium_polylepis.1
MHVGAAAQQLARALGRHALDVVERRVPVAATPQPRCHVSRRRARTAALLVDATGGRGRGRGGRAESGRGREQCGRRLGAITGECLGDAQVATDTREAEGVAPLARRVLVAAHARTRPQQQQRTRVAARGARQHQR